MILSTLLQKKATISPKSRYAYSFIPRAFTLGYDMTPRWGLVRSNEIICNPSNK